MTKKQPLHTRVANLEQNQTEMMRFLNGLIESHNKVLVGLETAFAKIGRRTAELDKRIESMENAMLMGDFKTKLPPKPGGGIIKP